VLARCRLWPCARLSVCLSQQILYRSKWLNVVQRVMKGVLHAAASQAESLRPRKLRRRKRRRRRRQKVKRRRRLVTFGTDNIIIIIIDAVYLFGFRSSRQHAVLRGGLLLQMSYRLRVCVCVCVCVCVFGTTMSYAKTAESQVGGFGM